MNSPLRLALALFLLLAHFASGADQTFSLVIDGDGSVTALGKTQKMVTHTELVYSWRTEPQRRVLTLHSMLLRMTIDGQEQINLAVDKDHTVITKNGQPREIQRANASPELRAKMDVFAAPLMTQSFDAAGVETARQLADSPGAKEMITSNVHLSGLLFHPLYPGARDEFQAPAEMAVSNGATIKGVLQYKRLPDGLGETYAVSGVLTKDSLQQSKLVEIRNIRNVITGRETYDPTQKVWVSGTFTMDTTLEMWGDGKFGGTSAVKGVAKLTRRAAP